MNTIRILYTIYLLPMILYTKNGQALASRFTISTFILCAMTRPSATVVNTIVTNKQGSRLHYMSLCPHTLKLSKLFPWPSIRAGPLVRVVTAFPAFKSKVQHNYPLTLLLGWTTQWTQVPCVGSYKFPRHCSFECDILCYTCLALSFHAYTHTHTTQRDTSHAA